MRQEAGSKEQDAAASAVEQMIMQLVVRHGEEVIFENVENEEGESIDLTVAQFIAHNLSTDNLELHNSLYRQMLREAVAHSGEPDFKADRYFVNHENIEISQLAAALGEDRFHLAESQRPRHDVETLRQRAIHLMLDFRMDYLEQRLREIKRDIAAASTNVERLQELMAEFKDKSELRNTLARKLGSNIIV